MTGSHWRLKYQPIPVKEILKKMKNISSIMVDLAYYSAFYGDESLASEIFKFGDQIDALELLLMMQAAIATRDAVDAEKMVSILVFSSAVGKISDATEEIARTSSSKMSFHLPFGVSGMDNIVFKTQVSRESWAKGRSLKELFQKSRGVLDVLLVKRADKWILQPDSKFFLNDGDTLFVMGTLSNVRKFRETIGDKEPVMAPSETPSVYRGLAESLLQLMNLSDFIVDAAYTSMLTSSEEIAKYVIEIEEYIDTVTSKIEHQILSTSEISVEDKAALIKIVENAERISDAARSMAEIILSGLEPHPVIANVLQESEERISIVIAGDQENGKRIVDLNYENYGAVVLAVKSKKRWYIRPPYTVYKIKKGDVLIVKYVVEAKELEGFPEELESREAESAIETVRREEREELGSPA